MREPSQEELEMLRGQMERGNQARQLLENPLYKEFRAMQEATHLSRLLEIADSSPMDMEKLRETTIRWSVTRHFHEGFESFLELGKNAEEIIDEIQQED